MQVDLIIRTMVQHEVDFLLIGGMNFMLRHEPVLTFDTDFWIHDTQQNRSACEKALGELDAEWGPTESEWGQVAGRVGWLTLQGVYCLTGPYGSIDIFRSVTGLGNWQESRRDAVPIHTAGGATCWGLNDKDLLACQTGLPVHLRKANRVEYLTSCLVNETMDDSKITAGREDLAEILAREEAKRERVWDPVERARVLLATLAWAEAQLRPEQRRNTKKSALKRQAMLLEQMTKDGVFG
jgi:hypothetical protein